MRGICFKIIISGYKQTHGLEEAKVIVDDIMRNADIDGNGNIEYNGTKQFNLPKINYFCLKNSLC